MLHKNNLTYKQIQFQIKPFTDREYKLKKMYLRKKITNAGYNNIISTDEMSIHTNENYNKGWSSKGEKCYIETNNKNKKGILYSLVMSVTNNKIIGYSLVKGSIKKDEFKNHINAIYKDKNNIKKNY